MSYLVRLHSAYSILIAEKEIQWKENNINYFTLYLVIYYVNNIDSRVHKLDPCGLGYIWAENYFSSGPNSGTFAMSLTRTSERRAFHLWSATFTFSSHLFAISGQTSPPVPALLRSSLQWISLGVRQTRE